MKMMLCYDKILIVTHGMLMHQIKPYGHIPNSFLDSFHWAFLNRTEECI